MLHIAIEESGSSSYTAQRKLSVSLSLYFKVVAKAPAVIPAFLKWRKETPIERRKERRAGPLSLTKT